MSTYKQPTKAVNRMRSFSLMLFFFSFFLSSLFSYETRFTTSDLMEEGKIRGGYNFPARIDPSPSMDLFLYGRFLFWKPNQEGMSPAIERDINDSIEYITENSSTCLSVKPGYKPGCKVGLGSHFEKTDWTLFTEYTYYKSDHKKGNEITQADRGEGYFLEPLWYEQILIPSLVTKLHTRWEVLLHRLDLLIGYAFYPGSKWTLFPYFGGSGFILDQEYSLEYARTNSTSLYSDNSSESMGIGPKAGAQMEFLFLEGFKILASSSVSLFYQYQKATAFHNQTYGIISRDNQVKKSQFFPQVDAFLALGWGSYFDRNRWHFSFDVGYEFQLFFDQNIMQKIATTPSSPSIISDSGKGALYLHGLTGSIRFDF